MTGEKNPNYGKERPFEHRINLKQGTALAKHEKRKISDEIILEIREKYQNDKITMTKLAETYEISRQYVSDIINKKVLMLEEIKDKTLLEESLNKVINNEKKDEEFLKKYNMTQKEYGHIKTNISKRKTTPLMMLNILKYKIDNPTKVACTIRSHFINQDPNITIDMVKNYMNGKIKLYEFEFPIGTYTWEDYNKMIDLILY
jgi:predicted DNA-binding protein YlxM (UPF0122 family)